MRRTCVVTIAGIAAMFSCQAIAQDAPVVVPAVVEVVEEVDAGEVVAEAEVEEVDEWVAAMPADNNLLKLFAYAQVEVALVRRVCDLNEEQVKALAEIDNAWVRKISNQGGNQENPNGQPGLLAMFFGARPARNNARVMADSKGGVKSKIDKHIAELLTEEQQKLYQQEKELRDKFRSESVADALIESLQPRLGMTDQQRAAVKKKLVPWAASTNLHTLYYFSGNNYYPAVPEHFLSQTLDKDQMAAFRGLQKHLFTDQNFNDGNAPIVIKQ